MKEKLRFLDSKIWGLAFGTVLPVLGLYAAWKVKGSTFGFTEFLNHAVHHEGHLLNTLTWMLLGNMFFFWVFFFQLKYEKASTGLVLVTLLETIAMMIYYFF